MYSVAVLSQFLLNLIMTLNNIIYYVAIDSSLNLDNLLIQIRTQVTPVWYKFGQAVGVPREILNKCLGFPSEECVVEVLDYWLRNNNPTWKDVADGLRETGLQCLANGILNVYKTGVCIIQNRIYLH